MACSYVSTDEEVCAECVCKNCAIVDKCRTHGWITTDECSSGRRNPLLECDDQPTTDEKEG